MNKAFRNLILLILFVLFILLLSSCAQTPVYLKENYEDYLKAQSDAEVEEADAATDSDNADNLQSPEPGKILDHFNIGLYNGVGVWDLNVLALQNFFTENGLSYTLFDEHDVTSTFLSDHFDLIWFPGGFAAEYRYYIPDLEPIIDFVNQGGYFVGSCAGAYFAADILSWQGQEGKDHDYPLNFFPGRAAGPLVYKLNWGDQALLILNRDIPANSDFETALAAYYFDGPYFDAFPEADYLALAYYETNNRPAVVAGKFGAGKYLLFGPHPEMGGINEQSGDYDPDGGNNAQWSWLLAILYWFGDW